MPSSEDWTLYPEELITAILHELRELVGATLLDAETAAREIEGAYVEMERAIRRFRRLQGQMERRIETLALLPALLHGDLPAMPKPKPRSVVAALSAVAPPSSTLRADVPADLRVLAAPVVLDIVLSHLVGNARRYAGPAATITVRAQAVDAPPEDWPADSPIRIAGSAVLLTVADDGPGIPSAFRSHLFRPFHRTEPDREGLGIGLWLCRRLVRAHGGDLVLEDIERGAAFLSLWPAAPDQEAVADGWPTEVREFGAQVRALRQQAGLTVKALASRAGLAEETVKLIEMAQRRPRAATRARMITALSSLADPASRA